MAEPLTMNININVALCPRPQSSGMPSPGLLLARRNKVTPLELAPKSSRKGRIATGAEPTKPLSTGASVPAVAFSANESPSRAQNQAKVQDQRRENSSAHNAKARGEDTTATNPTRPASTNHNTRSARTREGVGRPPIPAVASSADADGNKALQRTRTENEGTKSLLIKPSLPSSAPPTTAAVHGAASASSSKKSSMLTISSALCNDNFTLQREHRVIPEGASTHRPVPPPPAQHGAEKSVPAVAAGAGGGKARYQERFAPLRPTDRGQIEALQRRRREREQNTTRPSLPPLPSSGQEAVRLPAPAVEPPAWAVPAPGEARLEPVCESLGLQSAVDLTSQAVYRVGRSPASDVQLLHATSSRKHALVFHHPNGSCYVVDCGSAHGTFVNGVRVPAASSDGAGANCSPVVVPRRVRRGALVRFGGPGAPTFVLKSFSVGFENLVKDLPGVDTEADDGSASSSEESMDELLSGFPLPDKLKLATKLDDEGESKEGSEGYRGLRRVVSNEGEDGVAMDSPSLAPQEPTPATGSAPAPPAADKAQSEASLVRLNTRLNALGGSSRLPTSSCRRMARRASFQLSRAAQLSQPPSQPQGKRPAACLFEPREAKRARIELAPPDQSSELRLPELVLSPKPAIVSPLAAKKQLLSPADVQRAPPPPMLLSLAASAPTPVQLRETLTVASSEAFAFSGGCPKSLLIPSSRDLKGHGGAKAGGVPSLALKVKAAETRRVRFSDEPPQMFYPASVTPDELSADEHEHENEDFALAPTPPTTPRAMLAGL